jgi:DNA-binding transcriptional MerR regulator
VRIGELRRRAGVSDHVLRAWESRYGLLQPVRSPGGYRLYSAADAQRVRRMLAHLADGLSAAEAARAVLSEDSRAGADRRPPGEPRRVAAPVTELAGALRQALDDFDEPAAQAVLDRLMSDLSLGAVLRDVVVPYLSELGERWEQGTASIAQEHFASNIIRGRLGGLAQGWGNGGGPRAVLACPPGELHDLALMVFGIVLSRNGWTIEYLGMSTPLEELAQTVEARSPDLVVLASARPEILAPLIAPLAALAQRAPLALAGAAATPEIVAAVGARLLSGDPVTAADSVGWPR